MVTIAPPVRGANVQVGDYVAKAGIYTKPGVIMEKREDGTVVIDTDGDAIKKYHRHTNTSGLTPDEKDKFNNIMDEVMQGEKNADRINLLQGKIDGLKTDPVNKKVVETLRNEQAVLIRMSRELPRVYNYDVDKLRA